MLITLCEHYIYNHDHGIRNPYFIGLIFAFLVTKRILIFVLVTILFRVNYQFVSFEIRSKMCLYILKYHTFFLFQSICFKYLIKRAICIYACLFSVTQNVILIRLIKQRTNGFTDQKNWLPSTERLLNPNYVLRNVQKRCFVNDTLQAKIF